MTTECDFAFSRRDAPEICIVVAPSNSEGAGKTGCALHPRSRVQLRTERRAHEHTGSAGASRPSLRNGFTAYFVLSPVNGSFATVADGTPPANLTPAPRRQDHTTSPYARATLVSRSSRVHRISPRVRDDRERPSRRVRRPDSITDLPDSTSGIFLRDGMDGAIVSDVEVICPSGNVHALSAFTTPDAALA